MQQSRPDRTVRSSAGKRLPRLVQLLHPVAGVPQDPLLQSLRLGLALELLLLQLLELGLCLRAGRVLTPRLILQFELAAKLAVIELSARCGIGCTCCGL